MAEDWSATVVYPGGTHRGCILHAPFLAPDYMCMHLQHICQVLRIERVDVHTSAQPLTI